MGSGSSRTTSSRSYSGRNANQWLLTAEEQKDSEARNEFSSGSSRPNEGARAVPQYLIEADDLYDDDYGESRLVAPPVLGEAPSSYRDF